MINFTNYPIYIPTKGRADTAVTISTLSDSNLHFYIVVEKEDFAAYKESTRFQLGDNNIVVLPKSNQGIAYARNHCKQHAKGFGHKYHWQMDDNIKGFYERVDNKNIKTGAAEALEAVEGIVMQYKNIGIAGLAHRAFAFSATKDVNINKQCYMCVLVNNDLDFEWRKSIPEDTDYSLQVLFTKKFCTMVFNRVMIDKTATGGKGGNTEIEYGNNGRLERMQRFCKLWQGKVNFKIGTLKNGRPRINPNQIWRTFTQKPIVHDESVLNRLPI